MHRLPAGLIRFGLFELDPTTGELRKDGRRVHLQEKPLQLLLALARRPGELVTRPELQRALWRETAFLDFDAALNSSVRKLRDALGDSADSPRFIATVPRRGYRFLAPLTADEPAAGDPAAGDGRERRRWVGLLLLLAVAASAGAGAWWWHARRGPLLSSPQPILLAVLPFVNIDPDPGREFFTDGLTEELIAGVGSLAPTRLGVIARTSVMSYKGTDKRIPQIGRELGVSYLLEGSARREGGRVRITAQLIRASDATHLWAKSYERPAAEIFAVQREIAELIARSLEIELLAPKAATAARPAATTPAAYEAYLKGNYHLNRLRREELQKSVEQFQQAIALDPAYAPAWAGLARVHHMRASSDFVPDGEAYPLARGAALRALELDERLGVAHASLGFVALLYDRDFSTAEREFLRALALDSGSSNAHHMYSLYLWVVGRVGEARSEMERAVALDPLSMLARLQLAHICLDAGDTDEARTQIGEGSDLEPGSPFPQVALAWLHWRLGERARATAELERAWELGHDDLRRGLFLSYVYARTGREEEARALLEEVTGGPEADLLSPVERAGVRAALNEPEEARALLERAFREHDDHLVAWNTAEVLSTLRSDPRFRDVQARIGYSAAGSRLARSAP